MAMRSKSTRHGNKLCDLAAQVGVRDYPGRVKCAALSCHALRAALEGS
jgi:NifU-like protein involved in Fe-S cluster formation